MWIIVRTPYFSTWTLSNAFVVLAMVLSDRIPTAAATAVVVAVSAQVLTLISSQIPCILATVRRFRVCTYMCNAALVLRLFLLLLTSSTLLFF